MSSQWLDITMPCCLSAWKRKDFPTKSINQQGVSSGWHPNHHVLWVSKLVTDHCLMCFKTMFNLLIKMGKMALLIIHCRKTDNGVQPGDQLFPLLYIFPSLWNLFQSEANALTTLGCPAYNIWCSPRSIWIKLLWLLQFIVYKFPFR